MKKTHAEDLLKVGAHLGHKKNKVHPRAKKYIYKMEHGVSIIDLFQTVEKLDAAKAFAFELGQEGKQILFIATKKNAKEIVNRLSEEHKLHHLTNKWIAGFLTNFDEITKNVKKMQDLRTDREEGGWKKFVKHEQVSLEKKLNRIASIYSGAEMLTELPAALFIVDGRKERNAIIEAQKTGVKTIAIMDTNVDPTIVDFPIPANDDAISSIEYFVTEIVDAYVEGLGNKKEIKAPAVAEAMASKPAVATDSAKATTVKEAKADKPTVEKAKVAKPAAKKVVKKVSAKPKKAVAKPKAKK